MKNFFEDKREFLKDPLQFLQEKSSYQQNTLERLYLGDLTYLVTDPGFIKKLQGVSTSVLTEGSAYYRLKRNNKESAHSHFAIGDLTFSSILEVGALKYESELTAVIQGEVFALKKETLFSVRQVMKRLALKISATLIFGHRVMKSPEENAILNALELIEKETTFPISQADLPVEAVRGDASRAKKAKEIVGSAIEDIVKRTPDAILGTEYAQGSMTDDQYNALLAMLLTCYYSISSASSWMLYCIATTHGLQDGLAKEADTVSDSLGEIRYDALCNAKYSSKLIHEVLRLYPLTWWCPRVLHDELDVDGKRIRPGALMVVSPWQLGRDLKHWEAPNYFSLARQYNKPAFCPFGSGDNAGKATTVIIKILQIIALSFASGFWLKYQSHYPVPQPKPIETLQVPEIFMSL